MTRYIDQNNLSRRNIKKGIFLFGIKLRKKSCIYSNKRKSVLFIKKLLLRLTHSYLGIATITSLGVRARIFGCYKCRKHIQYIHVFTSIWVCVCVKNIVCVIFVDWHQMAFTIRFSLIWTLFFIYWNFCCFQFHSEIVI